MSIEHWITVILVLGGVGGIAMVVRPLVEDVCELIGVVRALLVELRKR